MEKKLLLDNRYQLENRIGSGGMASVYLAMDLKLKRKVAVKILHEHMAKNPEIKKRFQLEAQAISAIDHPNIVKIYDYSGINSEHSWLVTEVISGQNLGEYLSLFPKARLHPILASCIVREVSKALGAAHDKGIIHRDIKPENVMITETGIVRLMDFGIAKDLQQSSLTQTGTFIGSPGYMSVEQIKGKGVDYRSDIYSLCILYYELVTGVLPFKGTNSHDTVLKIMNGKYKLPKLIASYIPNEIESFIVKGMQRDPSKRFQSLEELNLEIDALLFKNGFVESHVELERYFLNKVAYEDRLKTKICSEYFAFTKKSSKELYSEKSTVLPALDIIKKVPEYNLEGEKTLLLQNPFDYSLSSLNAPIKQKLPNYLLKAPNYTHMQTKSGAQDNLPTIIAQEEKNKQKPNTQKRLPENLHKKPLVHYKMAHKLSHNRKNTLLSYKFLSAFGIFAGLFYVIFFTTLLETINPSLRQDLIHNLRENLPVYSAENRHTTKIDPSAPNSELNHSISDQSQTHLENSSATVESNATTFVGLNVKHQITIRTNLRPIKVAFIDIENGRDFEYIQSSYQEIYSLSPGHYELKTFHGTKIKKSKPFLLDEKKSEERIFTTEF